jgi:hypothetical protein
MYRRENIIDFPPDTMQKDFILLRDFFLHTSIARFLYSFEHLLENVLQMPCLHHEITMTLHRDGATCSTHQIAEP